MIDTLLELKLPPFTTVSIMLEKRFWHMNKVKIMKLLSNIISQGVQNLNILGFKQKITEIQTLFAPLFKYVHSSICFEKFVLSQHDLQTVFEQAAHLEILTLAFCDIGTIYEDFIIDPNIDYQLKAIDLYGTFTDRRYTGLQNGIFDNIFRGFSATPMRRNLKYIYGCENKTRSNNSITKIITSLNFAAKISAKAYSPIKRVS